MVPRSWLIAAVGAAAVVAAFKVWKEIQKGLSIPKPEGLESGGSLIARVLQQQGVKTIFCLSGGHVAPVYVEAHKLGIQIVDVRHEVNTVFAADAMARTTGIPGVAVVTAGPGVTNTVTAVKNAQMAESPVIILGGCTSIVLMGRGSLQDIDHLSLMKSLVKWSASPRSVGQLVPAIEQAFIECQRGVPGPVFVELPMDLLWPGEATVQVVAEMMPKGSSVFSVLARWYLRRHLTNILADANSQQPHARIVVPHPVASKSSVKATAAALRKAKKPVLVIGSQAMLLQAEVSKLVAAVVRLGVPVFCSGMARGLLGETGMGVQFVHNRTRALKAADVVIFAGVVADFRMQYGFHVNSKATFVTVNRSAAMGRLNRRPTIAAVGDVATFLYDLSAEFAGRDQFKAWMQVCEANEAERETYIRDNANRVPEHLLNPVALCRDVNKALADNSVVCVDGGDFVGSAAYTVRPRQPLSWLDPGAFGTLGVGAGFAMGVKAAHPEKEVWIIYGDGALGFSLMEFDTMVRHKLGVIAVVGNDAVWAQMIRDQARLLKSDVACLLNRTDYHAAITALGGRGFMVDKPEQIPGVLQQAKEIARTGVPVLINCHIARNDFREGAISV